MNKAALIFYKTENAVFLIVALLALLNTLLVLLLGGRPVGWGAITILLNLIVGSLGLLCWLWRNFLKNNPIDNRAIYAFVFVINRSLLYFFIGVLFALNHNIPLTLKQIQNHRTQLKKERFENRFMCRYIHGEAPIENGIWVFSYQSIPRYARQPEEIRFEVHCKDGKLHGTAKEEHLSHGLWIENYYTRGHLDSNAIFRRELRQERRDTLIKIDSNAFDYIDMEHICR